MTLSEGISRIKRIGKGMAIWGAVIGVLFSCVLLFMNTGSISLMVLMVLFPLLLGGVVFAFGWVLEGFLSPHCRD